MSEFLRRVRFLFSRARFERELEEEMRHHAALSGQQKFGNVALIKEDSRAMWTFAFWEQLAQDIRYGLRAMTANKLFTAMAVVSLALGIGANTAIYSLMDAVLMRALPVPHPGELAIVNWYARTRPPLIHNLNGTGYEEPGGGSTSPNFAWPAYEAIRDDNTAFSSLFAYKSAGRLNLVAHGQAEMREVEFVTGNFFSGLGVVPALGRLFGDEVDQRAASHAAVLSYDYWRDRLAGDMAVIGQTIRINDIPFSIEGVAGPEFFGVKSSAAPAVFIPMASRPEILPNLGDEEKSFFIDNRFYWVEMMGRLRPGVTLFRAQAELAARFHQYVLASAQTDKERSVLPELRLEEGASGVEALRRQFSKPLFVLMTMVAMILAIACANIANLLLSRASARRREMAVRLSLGASRLRVVRQLLTESLMLAVPGALLGLGVAAVGLRFLIRLMSNGSEDFVLRAQLDWRILAFTLGVAVATGILFGLAPALEATRVDITPALKETRASAPRGRSRRLGLSQILVVSQIAVSLVLVLGAGLFVRTLANLHSVELGFNQENLLTFGLDAGKAGFQDAGIRALYARLEARFRVLPGVRAETVTSIPLVSGWMDSTGIVLAGVPKASEPNTAYTQVGPTFFETMQIPILLGRAIDTHDVEGAPLAVVVNETFAKKYFPGQNPIGKHFGLDHRTPLDMTIVGVSKNARYNTLKRPIPPVSYISYLQKNLRTPPTEMFFELRTFGDPLAMAGTIREVVRSVAPNVPVAEIKTQAARIDGTIAQERTFADLCTVFAVLALVIASVGLYGSMAYAVSRRTNEIGIRMALGAARRGIVWMVLREVLTLAVFGLAIGLGCAWAGASAVKSFLFGMKPGDPVAIAVSVSVLAAAVLAAGYAPAWRASRIDPMAALRHE